MFESVVTSDHDLQC